MQTSHLAEQEAQAIIDNAAKQAPFNPISGITYQGRNVEVLRSGAWATFIQWKSKGFSVKKGEHGKKIIKFVEFTKKNTKGKVVEASAPKVYTVFSSEQVEIPSK